MTRSKAKPPYTGELPRIGEVVEIDNANTASKWQRCTVRHVYSDSFVFAYPTGGEGAAPLATLGTRWRFLEGRPDAGDGDPPLHWQADEADERDTDSDLTECCGEPLRFDPAHRSTSAGGLALVGALLCDVCLRAYVCSRSREAGSDATWTLAKGGRSINAGGLRIRVDGKGDVAGLMARIVRLPELEAGAREAAHEAFMLGVASGGDSSPNDSDHAEIMAHMERKFASWWAARSTAGTANMLEVE